MIIVRGLIILLWFLFCFFFFCNGLFPHLVCIFGLWAHLQWAFMCENYMRQGLIMCPVKWWILNSSSFKFVMPSFGGAPYQVPVFLPVPWLEDFWTPEALWFRIPTAGTMWLKVMNLGRSNFSSRFSHNQYGQSLFLWVADFHNSPFYLPSRVKAIIIGGGLLLQTSYKLRTVLLSSWIY